MDSLGRNTGVGCHSLLQGIFLTQGLALSLLPCRWIFYPWASGKPSYLCISVCLLACWVTSIMFDSLWPYGPYSLPGSSVYGESPDKNTGVGCRAFLQGIFLTQGSNPSLPHCRQILNHLSHQGSPRILEWVAYPFSRRYSPPRNQAAVSCIAGGFFTSLATCMSAHMYLICVLCSPCIYASIYQSITYYFYHTYTHAHTKNCPYVKAPITIGF